MVTADGVAAAPTAEVPINNMVSGATFEPDSYDDDDVGEASPPAEFDVVESDDDDAEADCDDDDDEVDEEALRRIMRRRFSAVCAAQNVSTLPLLLRNECRLSWRAHDRW